MTSDGFDLEELIVSLQQWIVQVVAKDEFTNSTPEDLFDGRLIVNLLQILDRNFFDEDFYDTVFDGKPDKSVLFLRICTKLTEYYDEVMQRDLYHSPNWNVNAAKIGRLLDISELSKLLLLILAAATSNQRATELLKDFSPSAQVREEISRALTDIDRKIPKRRSSKGNDEFEVLQGELNRSQVMTIITENQRLKNSVVEMEKQIILTQEKNAKLIDEIDVNKSKLEELINISFENDKNKRNLKSFQEEMRRVEADMEKLEHENEKLNREKKALMENLSDQSSQLKNCISELRTVKDNYELSKTKCYQLEMENNELQSVKEKSRNQPSLNSLEVKFLKEKLNHYVQEMTDHDAQQWRTKSLRDQIESLKNQNKKLEEDFAKEYERAETCLAECIKETERGDELEEQLRYLKEVNKKLEEEKSISNQTIEQMDAEMNGSLNGDRIANHVSDELLIALKDENEKLKKKLAKYENDCKSNEALLRDLEIEKKKNESLKERLEVAEKSLDEINSYTNHQVVTARMKNDENYIEISTLRENIDKLQKQLLLKENDLENIQMEIKEITNKKDSIIEKLENGIDKARYVIEMFQDMLGTAIGSNGETIRDLESSRKKYKKAEREIQLLERKQKQTHMLIEQEQRLITGEFYQMVFNFYSNRSKESDLKSFMDKQIKSLECMDSKKK
uniref:HOOK_N domain-containing protein n=1 Tax=Parastrongyloides trichosuri TaxID=131310 RepID=A0A0N4ZCX3_PARTI